MRYARRQLMEFDTQRMEVAKRHFAVSPSGLLVAVLVVDDSFRRFLIDRHPGRGWQALGLQPGVGGLPHLFDRQVERFGRFFL